VAEISTLKLLFIKTKKIRSVCFGHLHKIRIYQNSLSVLTSIPLI